MRIVRFLDEHGEVRWGDEAADGSVELLEGELLEGLRPTGRSATIVKRLAPLVPPVIMAIGLNYRRHAEETNAPIPVHPVLFMKNPSALNHPGDPVVIPKCCQRGPEVDYEGELVVVIGKTARDVALEDALDHVLGYTIGNDVSARRWQKHGGAGQWVRGKSFDTFCPLGPVLVTADELGDPQTLQLTTRVNGELRQETSTSDMIFSVADLVSQLSCDLTLVAGTVILTGTPSGVGFARKPLIFLKPGDEVAITIDRIGTLTNPIVAPEHEHRPSA